MAPITLASMLTTMGFVTIAVILGLLLWNRVAAVVALAGVPLLTSLIAGFSPAEISEFVGGGLGGLVGVVAMFVFAITYFGVMRDAGMFDPIIRRIAAFAGNAPVTICLATTMLAMAVHLDGAGATTFLITIPAMLPLFDRIGMKRLTLTACVGLGAGVMNLVPWGGPTARAAATSGVSPNELWVPLIPAQIAGMLAALGVAWILGRREGVRIAGAATATVDVPATRGDGVELTEEQRQLRRPKLFWFNLALTVLVIAGLIAAVAPPEVMFLVGLIIALLINYPGLHQQTERIEAHAKGGMLMATTLLAAGVFLGVLDGSGMIESMASSAANAVPDGLAPGLPIMVALVSVPLSLVFGPDPFYFGVLPVLISVGELSGVAGADIARAALIGEETVGFPISPLTGSFYLLVGLGGVEIGKHIRSLIGWAWAVSLVMLVVALLTGAVPAWAA